MFFILFILSLSVLFLVFLRVYFFLGFGKCFINLFFFLVIMVFINFICIFSDSILICLFCLVFLSFYSMLLILFGYGFGFRVYVVIFFKCFADLFVLLFLSNFLFLDLNKDFNLLFFYSYGLSFLLFLIFLIYSLLGLFGFWIFWAMEASYFLSCFMHSCGFIAVGLILFSKMSFLGFLFYFPKLVWFINIISVFSYLFFIIIFLFVKDLKKSFGFYSASSICFLFFLSINNPKLVFIYFFISSLIKITVFDFLSFLNKSFNNRFIFLFLLFCNLGVYSVFFINQILFSLNEFFCLIFFFKLFSLLAYSFKVFNFLNFTSSFYLINKGFLFYLFYFLFFYKTFLFLFYHNFFIFYLSYFFFILFFIRLNFFCTVLLKNYLFFVYNNISNNFYLLFIYFYNFFNLNFLVKPFFLFNIFFIGKGKEFRFNIFYVLFFILFLFLLI